MAADELRRRVAAEIERRKLNPNAVSERAGIPVPVLHTFLKQPTKTLDPITCRKLAAFFEWPEEDVFRWAGLLSPREPSDPLPNLHGAIWEMGWPEEVSRALVTITGRLTQGAGSEWGVAFQAELEEVLADYPPAAKGGRMSAQEYTRLTVRRTLERLAVKSARARTPAPPESST
jgi:hypothetical protein